MYKILISGYYGFNNIGDESILTAVVSNLRGKLDDIEITVLSHDPESTAEKYGVNSCDRKSMGSILKAVKKCDLLISGGGSLLQDVTSKKSILYYLFIMWLAILLRKDFMVYSQGIGPINAKFNRKLTSMVLRKASAIVVRDMSSKELLTEIGIDESKIIVTADPVLRIEKADIEDGMEILVSEGFKHEGESTIVGFAVKERKTDSDFVNELCISMEKLITERNAYIVLIPFHYQEDMAVVEAIETRLTEQNYGSRVCTISHKYLTDEMLGIIGNMDVLVGVRLHALIHAAIMDVPCIGISYDPKINAFLHSVGMKALCSIYDFKSEFLLEEFDRVLNNKDKLREGVAAKRAILIKSLDSNEEIIADIRKRHKG